MICTQETKKKQKKNSSVVNFSRVQEAGAAGRLQQPQQFLAPGNPTAEDFSQCSTEWLGKEHRHKNR